MNKQTYLDLTISTLETINKEWCENEDHMGEQAALSLACRNNKKSPDWFYDNAILICTDDNMRNKARENFLKGLPL